MKKILVCFLLSVALLLPLAAQSHISVPLNDPIYYVIEQAQLKGLCPVLSEAKPYSQHKIKNATADYKLCCQRHRLSCCRIGYTPDYHRKNKLADCSQRRAEKV